MAKRNREWTKVPATYDGKPVTVLGVSYRAVEIMVEHCVMNPDTHKMKLNGFDEDENPMEFNPTYVILS